MISPSSNKQCLATILAPIFCNNIFDIFVEGHSLIVISIYSKNLFPTNFIFL